MYIHLNKQHLMETSSSLDSDQKRNSLRRSTTSDINRMIYIGNDINMRPIQQKLGGMSAQQKEALCSAENLIQRLSEINNESFERQDSKQPIMSRLRISTKISSPIITDGQEHPNNNNADLISYIKQSTGQLRILSQRVDELKIKHQKNKKDLIKLWYHVKITRIDEDLSS